jgi:hypothetical protein
MVDPVSILADNLHTDTLYKVTITPSDDHKDVYTITQKTDYTCHTTTTGKDTIDWEGKPITLANTGSKDKNNQHYSLKWTPATIDTDKYPGDSVSYAYHTLATYHDPNTYNDLPDETIDVYHGKTSGTNPSNDISVPKEYDRMELVSVLAEVTASDTKGMYNPTTKKG